MHYSTCDFENDKYFMLFGEKGLIGALKVRDNQSLDAWEVTEVAAKSGNQGIGTKLYMVAMEFAGSRGLIPSRVPGQITTGAKAIWQKFFDGNLASHAPIPGNRQPESFLNQKYILLQPSNVPEKKLTEDEILKWVDEAEKLLTDKILPTFGR